jgi:hypothetical protein
MVVALGLAGCAAHGAKNVPALERNVISQAQLTSNHFRSAYDAVLSLRSNWLVRAGVPGSTSGVLVYLDNIRLGEIETLRSINVRTLSYIRYYDSFEASARWGPGHGSGVIYISMHPVVVGIKR